MSLSSVLFDGRAAALLLAFLMAPQAGPPAQTGPETFDVIAKATADGSGPGGAAGAITVPMTIQIDRYTPEHAVTTMTDALKHGGYPGFLLALRDAPPAGSLTAGGQKFTIRWARQMPGDTGRRITLVTETPVFFVGGARRGAKPTAGYEVAVMELVFDRAGKGVGTMAAAARVKPGGETGVRIDSYAEKPLALTVTVRPAP